MTTNISKSDQTGENILNKGTISRWRHKNILDLDDFSLDEINLVFDIADGMLDILSRNVKKVPTLRGKTIATMFYEPSTRTRSSFEMAAKYLSADTVSIDAAKSSVAKGESLIDSLRTLQALKVDVIIIRHPNSGSPYIAAEHLNIPIINAGDGCHAHPSQGLLDLYTMKRNLVDLNGKKVVIIGDILHSRVARSCMWGTRFFNINLVLCGPPPLVPQEFKEMIDHLGFKHVTIEHNLNEAVIDADVIMPLRIQKERQQSNFISSTREYVRLYQLDKHRLYKAKPGVLIMHPGPMNEGIEITREVACSSKSLIEQQVTNGVAIRMALLYLVVGEENR